MYIKEAVRALELACPLPLQESYDNAGLQIGLTAARPASGALLCLDVTPEVVEEAEREGCNLIFSHHPLLFHPLRRICGATLVERVAAMAVQKGIAIYSAHTNLDNAEGGVNFYLAELLGLQNVEFLQPFERGGCRGGSGVVGTLPQPLRPEAFLKRCCEAFRAEGLRYCEGEQKEIRRVALCGGAGDFLAADAVEAGADVLVTGEASYHRFLDFRGALWLLAAGHYESEHRITELMQRLLQERAPELRTVISRTGLNPTKLYIPENK